MITVELTKVSTSYMSTVFNLTLDTNTVGVVLVHFSLTDYTTYAYQYSQERIRTAD